MSLDRGWSLKPVSRQVLLDVEMVSTIQKSWYAIIGRGRDISISRCLWAVRRKQAKRVKDTGRSFWLYKLPDILWTECSSLLCQFIILALFYLIFPQPEDVFMVLFTLIQCPVPRPGVECDDSQSSLEAIRECTGGTEPLPWTADGQDELHMNARFSQWPRFLESNSNRWWKLHTAAQALLLPCPYTFSASFHE